jgi:hypothetical protein
VLFYWFLVLIAFFSVHFFTRKQLGIFVNLSLFGVRVFF